jgi:hypothetical protein
MFFNLIYIVLFLLILSVGFLVWYFIWFRPGYCSIPETNPDDLTQFLYRPYYEVRPFIKKLLSVVYELDPDYWIKNCGLDGYCYLYSIRSILRLLVLFLGEYLVISLVFTIKYPDVIDLHLFNLKTSYIDFSNKIVIIEQTVYIFVYTVTLVITLLTMINHVRKIYLKRLEDIISIKNLQARSLHIRGMIPEDIKGEVLKKQLDEYFSDQGSGKILTIKIIPNYAGLLSREVKRKELRLMWRLLQANDKVLKRYSCRIV